MQASYLAEKFAAALPYERYVATGKEDQQKRWQQVYAAAQLTPAQKDLVAGFPRDMKVLIVSGVWCGDCVQQCPLLQKIAEGNPAHIDLRLLDRDEHRDLIERLRINAGDRVPVVLFLAEDFELCGVYGDRTLTRYRALAAKHLAAACPLPIAVPDRDELSATLQDWLDEFERIQLMLLLSTRLRQKHGE
ncbi:MAG: thioredoxin family protein [Gemmataceae bacterium]